MPWIRFWCSRPRLSRSFQRFANVSGNRLLTRAAPIRSKAQFLIEDDRGVEASIGAARVVRYRSRDLPAELAIQCLGRIALARIQHQQAQSHALRLAIDRVEQQPRE